MAYPHKWSPISYKSSAGQRKHIGQRPMLYRWTTQPTRHQQVTVGLASHRSCITDFTGLTIGSRSVKEAEHHTYTPIAYAILYLYTDLDGWNVTVPKAGPGQGVHSQAHHHCTIRNSPFIKASVPIVIGLFLWSFFGQERDKLTFSMDVYVMCKK